MHLYMILCFGGSQAQVEGRHFQNPLLNVSESFGSLSVFIKQEEGDIFGGIKIYS